VSSWEGPLDRNTVVTERIPNRLRGGEVCSCDTGPFCRGRDSRDWADCSITSRHCNPKPKRRRRAMSAGEGDDA
jgi:hypothetical protein